MRLLMCGGIFLWGLATLAGSFMPNYWSFLVARIFVGMGEAMFSTVAPTLIAVRASYYIRSPFDSYSVVRV